MVSNAKGANIRINRNIVECKFFLTSRSRSLRSRINRNIVECKCTRPYKCIVRHLELIETLWNVNNKKAKEISDRLRELIETLWNVNESPAVTSFLP